MDGGLRHCTGGSDEYHPQEKEMQKGKMVVWGGLINTWEEKRREEKLKAKERRERYTHLNAQCQRKQQDIRKPSSVINAKK